MRIAAGRSTRGAHRREHLHVAVHARRTGTDARFHLYGGTQNGRWIIGLQARATKAIAGVFAQATVAGADDVAAGGADRRARRPHRHRSFAPSPIRTIRPAPTSAPCSHPAAVTASAPVRLRFIVWGVIMLGLAAVFALRVLPDPRVETDILALLPQTQGRFRLRFGARRIFRATCAQADLPGRQRHASGRENVRRPHSRTN